MNDVFVSFIVTALSKDEPDSQHQNGNAVIMDEYDKSDRYSDDKRFPYNGYSDEYLDRLEPNGNIPSDKHIDRYTGE